VRVGIGYDSHRFDPATPLVLGGVRIPDHPGLAGHSDGDAVAHSLIDALLGAAALGSIGQHFPDTDLRWRDADSMELLAATVHLVEDRSFRILNADVTIVTETPKVACWSSAMIERIASHLRVPTARVSVKGKSNEGMGWVGRGEGLAVMSVVLLGPIDDDTTPHGSLRTEG